MYMRYENCLKFFHDKYHCLRNTRRTQSYSLTNMSHNHDTTLSKYIWIYYLLLHNHDMKWDEMRVKSSKRMMNRQTTRHDSTPTDRFLSILDKVVGPSRKKYTIRFFIHSLTHSFLLETKRTHQLHHEMMRTLELEFMTCKSTHCVCNLL
jgi:hypothetical protein